MRGQCWYRPCNRWPAFGRKTTPGVKPRRSIRRIQTSAEAVRGRGRSIGPSAMTLEPSINQPSAGRCLPASRIAPAASRLFQSRMRAPRFHGPRERSQIGQAREQQGDTDAGKGQQQEKEGSRAWDN